MNIDPIGDVLHFVELLTYDQIFEVWQNQLWPDRKDPIEPVSCMKYAGGYQENWGLPAYYLGIRKGHELAGVNSIHLCADGSVRSRGLWVAQFWRGFGLGDSLLQESIKRAKNEGAPFMWSFPRQSSWHTYKRNGFQLTSEWAENINNTNAYCIIQFQD